MRGNVVLLQQGEDRLTVPPFIQLDLPDRPLGVGIADGIRVAHVGERGGSLGRIGQLQQTHQTRMWQLWGRGHPGTSCVERLVRNAVTATIL